MQSGNDLNITFKPVASYEKHEELDNIVKQNIPAPKNKIYKHNKISYADENIATKSTVMNKSLHSFRQYKPDDNNSKSNNNSEQSRSGHILRNKINLLLANNFYYPPIARRNNWSGIVEISLRIEFDGSISHVVLAKSSGYEILDNAAINNIRKISVIPDAHKWLGSNHYEMTLPIEYRLLDG